MLFLTVLVLTVTSTLGCNEAVCGSIVSKCSLLKSCDCSLDVDSNSLTQQNASCPCCDRCTKCLDYLFLECCSCFGLCPARNVSSVRRESTVFDFDAVHSLWDALTQDKEEKDWTVVTFPVDMHPAQVSDPKKSLPVAPELLSLSPSPPLVTVNCSVAYLRQCAGRGKCRSSCQTMGAASARWFDDGCCECVGYNCINYGINESRCPDCSTHLLDESLQLEDLSDEDLATIEQQLQDELYDD